MPSSRKTSRSRALKLRALLSLLLVGGSLVVAFSIPATLGLDLRGGTQIVLETRDSPTVAANKESTDRALEVLRRRVDGLGVAEPSIARAGERRIIVELPDLQEPAQAAEVLGRTAQLQFHAVQGETGRTATPGPDGEGRLILPDEGGASSLILTATPGLTGAGVGGAERTVEAGGTGRWKVVVDFNSAGESQWRTLTGQAACAPAGDPKRRIAIVLDGEVVSSPQVDPSVPCEGGIAGGRTEITGGFTAAEAKDLAVLISGGALPVPVEVIEQRVVGPTLGQAAIDASLKAALIGIVATGLFIVAVYRLFGALATIALACYAVMSYAALVAIGATLTLPGLAGFVLAIGIAIDANVLVFERAREEYAGGGAVANRHNLRAALRAGFARAWTAIVDSNVTTLLAAGLLFYFAGGPVKGFGVTLSVGVLASMVSALIVARTLAEIAVDRPAVRRRPLLSGIASPGRVREWLVRRDPNLMGRRGLWLGISGALLVVAIAGIAVRGLNLGVEFTGGRLVEYSTTQRLDPEVARTAVAQAGFPRAIVQASGTDDITVRANDVGNADELRIRDALGKAGGGEVSPLRDELIGPSLGKELRTKAIVALLIALGAQMLYLAIRFRATFGVATVLAMFHDVVLVTGAFAWMGRPIDGVFLAAVLTIVGLSVNDSVVVFDRVRETWAAKPTHPFDRICNEAVLATVPRTVNTGLGAMFILAALAILGGDSLVDFAIALLLGLVVGTFSSVFTATPLAIYLQRWVKPAP
ncbi:MAG: protein translocase subunit SecD [Sporichthyaceae bacterium]